MASWLDEAKTVDESAPGWLKEAKPIGEPAKDQEHPAVAGMSTPERIIAGTGLGMVKVARNAHDILLQAGLANPMTMAPTLAARLLGVNPYSKQNWQEFNEANQPLLNTTWSKEHLEAHAPKLPASLMTGDPATDARLATSVAQRERKPTGPGKLGEFLGETAATAPAALAVGGPLRTLVGPAAPLLQRVGLAAGAGGAEGALAGGLTANWPEERGHRATTGAVLGSGVSAAIPAAGAAVNPLRQKIAQAAEDKSIDWGRNAIAGVSNSLARRKPLSPEAVRAAFEAGAIKFGSSVKGIQGRLLDAAEAKGEVYRGLLEELSKRGVSGPNAEALIARFTREGEGAFQNSLIGTEAEALKGAAAALGKRTPLSANNQNLGLMQAELMKREAQQAAAGDFVKEGVESLSGGARKRIAGIMREEVENSVRRQSYKAPQAAAQFEPVKEDLHRLLEGLGQASEGAARYARRSPFGLHEAMGLASGMATGNPIKAVEGIGLMHMLKDRGASSGAVMARALAKALAPKQAAAPVLASTDADVLSLLAALKQRGYQVGPALAAADDQGAQ